MEPFSVEKLGELLATALPPATRKALELAYLLSTQVEEGRPLRFAFVLSEHVNFLPERKLEPPAATSEAIRRLVLATDPQENAWRLGFDESTGTLSISGVAALPSALPSSLPSAFHETVIEVDGTASVSIRVGNARARYFCCRHFVPNAEERLLTLVPPGLIETVAQQCFTTTGMDPNHPYIPFERGYVPLDKEPYLANREKLEATTRQVAAEVVPAVVLITLRRMRELQHGGCIIVSAQDTLPSDLFAKSNRLVPAFESGPSKYGYNWAFLAYVRALTHLILAKRDGVAVLEDFKGKPVEHTIEKLHDRLRDYDREAGRYARLWARFSVIDGIVVLSPLLEPLVFGGITSIPPTFTDVADRGARHRAAAYCATRLPGAVAIVVSQDGSVTAYRKPAESLEEIELLL